jgi:formylglycine-generating enzyme required for sulfatase activity
LVSLKRRAEALGLQADELDRVSSPPREAAPEQSQPESLTYEKSKPASATPMESLPVKKMEKESQISHQTPEALKPAPIGTLPDKFIFSNGMDFVRVPAGRFLMGSAKENELAFDDERPQHTVDLLYDYFMARFPVTNQLYQEYVKARGLQHPVSGWEAKKNHPIGKVSREDAIAYCDWLNGLLKAELPAGLVFRLPTEAEWEKAARGINGREYPWGNKYDKNRCNIKEGGRGGTTPVGLYSPQGDSPYGCADMAGNVWEWTHSVDKPYPYDPADGREDKKAAGRHVRRGGSFTTFDRSARCACRGGIDAGSPVAPGAKDVVGGILDLFLYIFSSDDFGFRVVAAPKLP